jgi:V8-like Glu-specific endopeptidase
MKRASLALLLAAALVVTFTVDASSAISATAAPSPAAVTPSPSPVAPVTPNPKTPVSVPVVPESDSVSTPDPSSSSAIGALFSGDGHYCSASVVHSAAGDLVLTAAHCVHDGAGGGYRTDIVFEPGYHDGVAPFGQWTVTQALVAPGWAATSDPDLDFAFLTVHQDGNPATLESLTGADTLGLSSGFVNFVTLTGYPNTSNEPVVCQNSTTQQDTYQTRIACPGFPDGTSGGPWVINPDPTTKLGTVIGVIGGYQLGGNDPDVSYSSYFDDDISALYATATS